MKTAPKKMALVYMAHDGITSYYSGIGTLSLSYVGSLPKIVDKLREHGVDTSLFFVTPADAKAFHGYSASQRAKAAKIAERYGGRIIEIAAGSGLGDISSGISGWETMAGEGARAVEELAQAYDKLLLICIDRPFLRVAHYLRTSFTPNDISKRFAIVLVPDTIESIYEPAKPEYLAWEKMVFDEIRALAWTKIGYVSLYLKQELASTYNIQESRLIPALNGLTFGNPRYKKFGQKSIQKELESFGIPTDRPLIVSAGRMERYKGYAEVLKMVSRIPAKYGPYFVIVGGSRVKNNPLMPELRTLQRRLGVEGAFLFRMDPVLPFRLWQWKNTKFAAQISEIEPFGLAVTEAKLLAREHGPVLVASERGGLYEQIEDGYTGFRVTYGDVRSYDRKISTIFSLSEENLSKIRQRAADDIIVRYDSQKNITDLLVTLEPGLGQYL